MRNMRRQADLKGGIIVPLTVPAGTKSGDPVAIGAAGLYGIATTDQVTADQAKTGQHPQGLKANQAAVILPGVGLSIDVPAAQISGIADGGDVYFVNASKTYAAAGDVLIGWKIGASEVAVRGNQ